MILGTHDFNGPENLKVAALNSGNQLGTLSSGTRQRDGLIELVDIAPTIFNRLCIKSNLDYEKNVHHYPSRMGVIRQKI